MRTVALFVLLLKSFDLLEQITEIISYFITTIMTVALPVPPHSRGSTCRDRHQ